ncbi:hypothetical protein M9H77_18290 [Catharanthus roseus]|uniref:Uncharacterized protein n=1 Tax=Catharanthus roseus TaxID=4058 RepID=A0ACC0B772_CATRO|nr:hypothetical protein M9H77_18290 [Catharanthus roseus]
MAPKTSPNLFIFSVLVSITIFTTLPRSSHGKLEPPTNNNNYNNKIRGMFVFGSSLVDNGNNNFLQNSLAKADYYPYGIDFPFGPTGRFTNGKNVIDLLCELLKLPSYIPPFADPSTKGSKILHGVNFASGGSGILDNTGALAGEVFTLNEQINKFENVIIPELKRQVEVGEERKGVGEYLFVVGTGGNDYSFNYFISEASSNVSIQVFTANLTSILSHQLQRLYNLGARKFVLMAVNPNGCTPMAMAFNPPNKGCIQSVNRAVHLFNINLRATVDNLKKQMTAANLVFVNSYKIIRDIIKNPSSKGFTDAKNPCCELGSLGILCNNGGKVCGDRSKNVFFDGLHPTEAVNVVIANKAFSSMNRKEVYPMTVKMLSEIST